MTQALSIATWNIHKGFSQFNGRMMVHELRDLEKAMPPDVMVSTDIGNIKRWPTASCASKSRAASSPR